MEVIIKWRTISNYIEVDEETGEIVNEIYKKDLDNYIIIKKTKHVKFNNNEGTIEYTIECRKTKYKQTKLF